MKPQLLLLGIIAFPFFAIAQTNYKDGYVITDANDTIKGYINYREWNNNPLHFDFKSSTSNIITNITTANVKQITISGFDTYQRFEVSISMNPVNYEQLTESANTKAITNTVFLQLLVKGNRLSLYTYTDKVKQRFYILDSIKNIPEELLYVKELKEMQEQTENIYRQQLAKFAVKYNMYSDKIRNKISSANYNEANISDIVNRINDYENKTVQAGNHKQKNTSYFAGIGILQYSVKYTGQDLITANGLDGNDNMAYKNITTKKITPRIDAGINFYSKEWVPRLVVKTELSAYKFASTVNSYTRYPGSDAENHYTYTLNGWSFTITPQLLCKLYSSYNLKAYIGAGIGINLLADSKNSLLEVTENQQVSGQTIQDYVTLQNLNLAFTGRAGILLKQKLDIFIYANNPLQYVSTSETNLSIKSGVVAFCLAWTF